MFYLGLDLGQANDFTAQGVLEKVYVELTEEDRHELDREFNETVTSRGGGLEYKRWIRQHTPTLHQLRHIQRFDLGTTYPQIVASLKEMVSAEPLRGKYAILADATGVGRPVIDLLKQARLNVIPIIITGGHQVNLDGNTGFWNVPKRDLVSTLQVLLGKKRLQISKTMPNVDLLLSELLKFQMTITENANDTYEGRQGAHDDMVLAVALAAWWSENRGYVWRPSDPTPPNPWLNTGLSL